MTFDPLLRATTRVLCLLAVGTVLCGTAGAVPVAPFSFDNAFGRLPKNVVPLDYVVAITPDAAARTIAGTETVTLDFREATATLQLNSLNETLDDVRLDGEAVASVVSADDQQLTTLTLARAAPPGRHKLTFSYRGKIESGPRGMFAQEYVDPKGAKGLLLSTKFESTDARRMFPCWDEPAFRATFELTATVPAAWAVISNMPVARRRVHESLATTTFERTPRMPTYLLEFSAGDFARITARVGAVELGVWAVRGQEQGGAAALDNARQILADYDDYFGFPYPLPKLDAIAIPGGFTGAMENWGAITYNDQLLLVTPSSTLRDRQQVFSVQAHEMAHQWNGDLVTMGWWDDIWLNESFASWREAKETDARNPSWHWWEGQDEAKESAMRADARVTSHAIQQHVTDELQVTNAFDPSITYRKGEAVLRMLEAHLGEDVFRDGVRGFMKAHAYSNANSTDLWNALGQASGRDVAAIAAGWIEQPGFPLVSVQASCDAAGQRTVRLAQRRFLLRGTDPAPSQWNIPLRIRSGATAAPRSVLLTPAPQAVPAGRCDEPLSVNAGAVGYFRAAYDEATLRLDTKHFEALPDADRIVLLDDEWALVEAGQEKLASYLDLASGMGADLNERAWSQISDVLETIEYDVRASPRHDAFVAYASAILRPLAARLGWDARPDDTPGVQKLRRDILADLGKWGDAQVIAEARRRFAAFLVDRAAIRPDDQEMVLAIVARHADAATYEQLHALAKAAPNETELRRDYAALMKVRDPQLARQSAQLAVSPEIPPQAGAMRLRLVAGLAAENPQVAWVTLQGNVEMLMAPQGRYAPLILAQYSPEIFWDAAPLEQVEGWVKAHVPAQMADNIARGMESARVKVAEKVALAQAVDRFLAADPHEAH
jgi:aminopeptidase N